MLTSWPSDKHKNNLNSTEVKKMINIISQIRSFKNELNVSPGSFIDIFIGKINKKNQSFLANNENILKKIRPY